MNRDKLNHVSPERVAQASLDILDRVTDLDKEVQPAAVAMTLIAFCRRTGADVGDLFAVARNILNSKFQSGPSFNAIQLYMKHEV